MSLMCITYLLLMLGLPASSAPSGIHFTLLRRGGAFDPGEIANMTFLAEQLAIAEERFSATKREIRGNKVVRVARGDVRPAGHYDRLLGEVGRSGSWSVFEARRQTPCAYTTFKYDCLQSSGPLLSMSASNYNRLRWILIC